MKPAITVPVEEAWLFQNKEALGLVMQGLQEARESKFVKVNWKANKKFADSIPDEDEK